MKATTVFSIRKATRKDSQAIQKLFLELYEYHTHSILVPPISLFVQVNSPQEYAFETVENYFENKYFLYVAQNGKNLIGYICGKVNVRSEYVIHPEGFVEDWFVTEKMRGQGIGRLLYDVLKEKFISIGCQTIALEVFFGNTRAVDLYQKMGFHKDAIFMKKRLTK